MEEFGTLLHGLVVGFITIAIGYTQTRKTSKMKDIPTSKISSAAIGSNVEVVGNLYCEPDEVIESPLSGKKGYAFIWEIQRYVRRDKRGSWDTENIYFSNPLIYIKDTSDAIAAVDLAACEFDRDIFDHIQEFSDRNFELPEAVKNIFDTTDIINTQKTRNFFMASKFRIRERVLKMGQRFYVFGTAHEPPDRVRTYVEDSSIRFATDKKVPTKKTVEIFEKLNKKETVIRQFDENNDGVLDQEENRKLYQAIEERILKKFSFNSNKQHLNKTRIFFSLDVGANAKLGFGRVFLSNRPEKKVTKEKGAKGKLFIVIGAFMIALTIFSFLHSLLESFIYQ